MVSRQGARIHISGIVQGVGFRPFVYALANRLALTGWVRNTSSGVDIQIDGPEPALQVFLEALRSDAPPLARIDDLMVERCPVNGFDRFEILQSQPLSDAYQPISPDVSICADCLRELFDPQDRRYRYPFINCTNCGPRFTIISDIPYDRPQTTMASFAMCPECAAEYNDPGDRRFHAQPIACPVCGPQVWLEMNSASQVNALAASKAEAINEEHSGGDRPVSFGDGAILKAQELLSAGRIIAIKGLGGFHLACDANNPEAVSELRRRKLRVDKPFALMMADIETVEQQCRLPAAEREMLISRQRPIVILERRPSSTICAEVAPFQKTLGVMLPYTPLHYLILSGKDPASKEPALPVLVMTSGNLSEEPIAFTNQAARHNLSSLADAFLMHNREIYTRCDDSVLRLFSTPQSLASPQAEIPGLNYTHESKFPLLIRRARGYAPFPLQLPWKVLPLLAVGPELKNTFCLARDQYAFLSQHIGDMENYETQESFEEGIAHYERLFRIQPQVIAYDLHPDYLATRYALERAESERLQSLGIQHHHAHLAACMAENNLDGNEKVIGIAFDGTGYGPDGAIWGGEAMLADFNGYQRLFHLAYAPLPGGEAAIRKPARIALAYLWSAGIDWETDLPCVESLSLKERQILRSQLERGINTPLTSSMGRLFDAVAALAGVRQAVNYEAQAAIELEALVDPWEDGSYPIEVKQDGNISLAPLLHSIVRDIRTGSSIPLIAARFHNSIARLVLEVCMTMRSMAGISKVALSGGVWQNVTLLRKTITVLHSAGFEVLLHRQVPPNDGGLSFGQAAIVGYKFRS